MLVDLQRPSQMHEFRDPDVGDVLQVITAFPPARGVARDLHYVDFELLRSVHGLAIKGENDAPDKRTHFFLSVDTSCPGRMRPCSAQTMSP